VVVVVVLVVVVVEVVVVVVDVVGVVGVRSSRLCEGSSTPPQAPTARAITVVTAKMRNPVITASV
jgi:hypothetical protein